MEGSHRVAIVLAGGDPADADVRRRLPQDAYVVAADSGLHQAATLGLHVDRIIGDLDSADPAAVAAAEATGTIVQRYPADKDATDLELALAHVRGRGAERVTVVGGAGGRLDHFLANLLSLTMPSLAPCAVDAFVGDARLTVARGGERPVVIDGAPGSLVTLVPVGGPARGIVTDGLQYPLAEDDLAPGTSRGVSNVLVATRAEIGLDTGVLLVVQPEGGAR